MALAISPSHLSPLASSFSLLYSNSSRVSVAYSALGALEKNKVSQVSLVKKKSGMNALQKTYSQQ